MAGSAAVYCCAAERRQVMLLDDLLDLGVWSGHLGAFKPAMKEGSTRPTWKVRLDVCGGGREE